MITEEMSLSNYKIHRIRLLYRVFYYEKLHLAVMVLLLSSTHVFFYEAPYVTLTQQAASVIKSICTICDRLFL